MRPVRMKSAVQAITMHARFIRAAAVAVTILASVGAAGRELVRAHAGVLVGDGGYCAVEHHDDVVTEG